MATHLPGILFWLLHLALVSAITWTGPSSTTRSKHSVTSASRATAVSSLPTRATHIDTPLTYEPPHICGYIRYDIHSSYTCASHNTCLWNSHLRIVGCGNPTSINYITSCVPYRALGDCDADCLADPSIIQCGSDLPHCVTPRVGPEGSYSILHCQAAYDKIPLDVHLTYNGQTTTGHLPRWLGDDGNITYATRIPRIIVKTTETGGLTFQETQTSYSTLESGGVVFLTKSVVGQATRGIGGVTQQTQSCAPDANQNQAVYVQQQTQKEIVAGSIIGSAMVLVVVVFVVGMLVGWRRKLQREEKRDDGIELRGVESGEEES
ncbi:hypothetical protein N431DRAFT_422371 [Stipitochalara longipes BDJ]|nr:hypothetical protein N431DRAFT_422371 [Stipitochalara longipes BDJ]